MKVEFSDFELGSEIILTPETVEEVGKLLRFATNARAEKPSIVLRYSKNPICFIFIGKVKKNVQKTGISPNLR